MKKEKEQKYYALTSLRPFSDRHLCGVGRIKDIEFLFGFQTITIVRESKHKHRLR